MRIRYKILSIFVLILFVFVILVFFRYQKTLVVFLEKPDDSSIPKQITLKGKIKLIILYNVYRKPNLYYPDGVITTQWNGYIYVNERRYCVLEDKLYLMNVKGYGVWQIPSLPKMLSECGIELLSEKMEREYEKFINRE